MTALLRLPVLFALATLISVASCKKKHEQSIKEIKETCNKINSKLDDYTLRQVDDLAAKEGSGNLKGYFRDEEAKKIYAERFTHTSRTFSEYYFDDGYLIYVLKQEYIYNKPDTYTEEIARSQGDSVWYDDKKTKLAISRFYFSNNKLIKWINGDNINMPVNTGEFVNKESELWAESIVHLKQLKEAE